MKSKKKAAATLLVEILLVSLAVSLGVLIFGWSNSFVQSTRSTSDDAAAKLISCKNNVNFNIWVRDKISMACYNDTLKIVQLYIENQGKYISKFNIKIINSTLESKIFQINASLDTAQTKRYIINYSEMNDFVEIEIIPVLIEKDQSHYVCTDTTIKLSRIRLVRCENIIYFR